MGRWSQRMLRGGGGGPEVVGLKAPLLTHVGTELDWVYDFDDPNHWSIQSAALEAGPFTQFDVSAGPTRSYDPVTPGLWWRVQGLTISNSPETDPSNAVFVS